MEKMGYSVINKNRTGGKPAKCANCGKEASFRVTFKDYWEKLIISLCKDCANKRYEEMNFQRTLGWPGIA